MNYLMIGAYALCTSVALFSITYLIFETIRIFVVGRTERLEYLNSMLRDEYRFRELDSIEEVDERFHELLEQSQDIVYKQSEILKFKRKAAILCVVFLVTSIGSNKTNTAEVQEYMNKEFVLEK